MGSTGFRLKGFQGSSIASGRICTGANVSILNMMGQIKGTVVMSITRSQIMITP